MALSGEMAKLYTSCCNSLMPPPALPNHPQFNPGSTKGPKHSTITAFAANSGGFSLNSILKRCEKCEGKGAIECPGCKGTGKNKKNGNIFERWNRVFASIVWVFGGFGRRHHWSHHGVLAGDVEIRLVKLVTKLEELGLHFRA